jgi:hypothetical protein
VTPSPWCIGTKCEIVTIVTFPWSAKKSRLVLIADLQVSGAWDGLPVVDGPSVVIHASRADDFATRPRPASHTAA